MGVRGRATTIAGGVLSSTALLLEGPLETPLPYGKLGIARQLLPDVYRDHPRLARGR